jgi:acyl-coenzyme A thioesterase PaaI-like protein
MGNITGVDIIANDGVAGDAKGVGGTNAIGIVEGGVVGAVIEEAVGFAIYVNIIADDVVAVDAVRGGATRGVGNVHGGIVAIAVEKRVWVPHAIQ